MSQDPLAVVQRWFEEVWNQRRAETIDELLSAESICVTDDGFMKGPEEFRQRMFIPFIAAFPDLWIRIEDTLIEGDQVVVRWEATGTHTGNGLGFTGTGRQIAVSGLTWLRVRDGQLVQGWQQSSLTQVLQSLREVPALSESPPPQPAFDA